MDVTVATHANVTVQPQTSLEIWGYGILFVTIINFSSVLGILFFPLMNKSFYTVVMRVMIGLAIGSLSGSAIFHLIPKAFGLAHGTEENYIFIASFIWLSIWIVMILECTIKIVVKSRDKTRQQRRLRETASSAKQNGDINQFNMNVVDCSEEVEESVNDPLNLKPAEEVASNNTKETRLSYHDMPRTHSTLSLNRVLEGSNVFQVDVADDKSIKTVAWIVIIGDSLHNFIDGVSIGAGFTQSFSSGLILSLAVMCDEFPHELGDFAILINSGLSVKRAIFFNFLSALTCYAGLALGVLLGKIEFEQFIFAFAAGIFLYVSLADLIPEVTEAVNQACDQSTSQAWLVLLNHHIGVILGVLILYVLATTSFES